MALALLAPALAGGAAAQQPLTPFQQETIKAIYAVLPYQREQFALVGPAGAPLALYPDGQSPERIECQQSASFKILSRASEAGAIAVNVCPEHVARLRSLAAAGPRGFDTVLDSLQKGMPPFPADKLRAGGWYHERSNLSGGAEVQYFAVLLVGHGVIGIPTVIVLTDAQAVVVQAATTQLCGEGGNPFPLCADPKGTLSAIAQRLLK